MSRRVLVVTHPGNPVAVAALTDARRELEAAGFEVTVDRAPSDTTMAFGDAGEAALNQQAVAGYEFVVVLGGDGTILRAAELTHGTDIPILGINLGHVGFLAEAEREDIASAVARLAAHDFSVEERTVAAVTVERPGDSEPLYGWALNEATIEKASRQRLIEVGIEVDARPLSSFGCDGIIMATATGSTAHAFSAGGPILWPDVAGVLLVPLAAHALFSRPLVIGPTSEFKVTLLKRSPMPAFLTCDGRRSVELPLGSVVTVRLGTHPLKFARLTPAPFTDRLVSKLSLPVVGWREAADVAANKGDEIAAGDNNTAARDLAPGDLQPANLQPANSGIAN